MSELFTSGSVGGAAGNRCLYPAALPPDDENGYAALEAAADFAARVALFLDFFGLRRERERLQERLDTLMAQRGIGAGGALTRAEFLALSRRGEGQLSAGRAREAEQIFSALLSRFSPPPTLGEGPEEGASWAYKRALTLGNLGRALVDQGRPAAAAEIYRQKLATLADQEQSAGVKRETGVAHTDLADALRNLGRYAEARAEYEASLKIHREQENTRDVAVNLGQLGTLALRQRDYAEARRRYTEALTAFQALGEPETEAVFWHQLGMVAQEQRDWDEAERCYRKSLRLREAGNDLAGVAQTANQLGAVCQLAGRPAEAETWFRRALDAFSELGAVKEMAFVYGNLILMAMARNALDQAEKYADRAQILFDQLGTAVDSKPWQFYGLRAQIAERRGCPEEARRWRRREQESFAAFAGAGAQLPRWVEPVVQAVVAACEGSAEARTEVDRALGQMAETDDWRNLPPVIRCILDGERDAESLTDGLDRYDALIVRRILESLAGKPPPPAPPPKSGEGSPEAITLEQVFGLVEAGCRGDAQAGQLAYGLVTQVLQAAASPPEIRALGKPLQRILEGLRGEEALAGLPAELRPPVEELLRRVE